MSSVDDGWAADGWAAVTGAKRRRLGRVDDGWATTSGWGDYDGWVAFEAESRRMMLEGRGIWPIWPKSDVWNRFVPAPSTVDCTCTGDDDESVKLQSGDNEVFSVSKKVACQAVTIKEMLDGQNKL